MRLSTIVPVVALLVCAPGRAGAQVQWDGTIGIYDDVGMTVVHGAMEGPSKEVYLGVRLDPTATGFAQVEFSIAGLEAFDAAIPTWLNNPSVVVGSLAAPLDTVNGTGGIDVVWPACQPAEVVVARLLLVAISPPQDATLVIQRRYPSTIPERLYPWASLCDEPCFGCHWQLAGGTYTLNPSVAVQPLGWGAIKNLYRTP